MSQALKPSKNIFLILWYYTLLVILWGAWVRISHSGNGCGDHWPLCSGQVIPDLSQKKTLTEYLHRLTSGVYGLYVFYIFLKYRNASHQGFQKFIKYLFALMITEALLGAALVKFELVTINDSFLRLGVMMLHQTNSFLLTAVCFILYKMSQSENTVFTFHHKIFLFMIVPITGAIAALSVTLFPSISLLQGIIEDLNQNSHIFLKLRIVHPLVALTIAGYLIYYFFNKQKNRISLEFFVAVLIGIITLVTLSPIPLKLIHLLLAHLIWSRFISETSLSVR